MTREFRQYSVLIELQKILHKLREELLKIWHLPWIISYDFFIYLVLEGRFLEWE
jgi:hypothetical protein